MVPGTSVKVGKEQETSVTMVPETSVKVSKVLKIVFNVYNQSDFVYFYI